MKKFKVQAIIVLEYKKRNDHKIFRSCTNLIASYSDSDGAFTSMHQSIMTKIKKLRLQRVDFFTCNNKAQY